MRMYRERQFRLLAILWIVLLAGGCNSTRRLYSGAELTRDKVARIRTKFSEKSGRITRRVTIESIGGETVDSESHEWIAVLPGTHRIYVSFYKRIDPPGLNIGVKLNLFGSESDLAEPKHSLTVNSTVDQYLVVNVQAGKSYHIAANDNIRQAQPFLLGKRSLRPATTYPVRSVGSWEPEIAEEP